MMYLLQDPNFFCLEDSPPAVCARSELQAATLESQAFRGRIHANFIANLASWPIIKIHPKPKNQQANHLEFVASIFPRVILI